MTLLEALTTHLNAIFPADAIKLGKIRRWKEAKRLPVYLSELYAFYIVSLFEYPTILCVAQGSNTLTPVRLQQQLSIIQERYDVNVIYVAPSLSQYARDKLIQLRVAFIVPGNQVYLPPLGIDLREYFIAAAVLKNAPLNTTAQLLVLRQIYGVEQEGMSVHALADSLGVSDMSISRAFKELSANDLIEIHTHGRVKALQFKYQSKALWNESHRLLQTPVKKRFWIEATPSASADGLVLTAPSSAETALCFLTMLESNHASNQVALSASRWQTIANQYKVLDAGDSTYRSPLTREAGVTEVEVWKYDPLSLPTAEANTVDGLSLWLATRHINDERVELAREALLEEFWRGN